MNVTPASNTSNILKYFENCFQIVGAVKARKICFLMFSKGPQQIWIKNFSQTYLTKSTIPENFKESFGSFFIRTVLFNFWTGISVFLYEFILAWLPLVLPHLLLWELIREHNKAEHAWELSRRKNLTLQPTYTLLETARALGMRNATWTFVMLEIWQNTLTCPQMLSRTSAMQGFTSRCRVQCDGRMPSLTQYLRMSHTAF